MAQCRTKPTWKSGFALGISRLPWICVVSCVLSFVSPSTLAQEVPDFDPVYFTAEPSDVIAVPGSTVTLNCSVHSSLVPTIRWTQEGSQVLSSDPTRTLLPNGALRVSPVSLTNEGSYQCSAELVDRDFFTSLISRRGSITVAKLNLQDGPASKTAYEGDTVYFQCNFNSVPAPEIHWQKNGEVLDLSGESSARYTLMPSGGLEIRGVRSSDSGNYRCQGTNRMLTTPVRSPNAVLMINSGVNPNFQFIKTPQDTEAPVGETVVLEAATDSQAVFTWFKDGEEIYIEGSGAENRHALVGQGSLRIKQVREIDTGLYRILATSSADGAHIERTVKVTALVPLEFNIRPQNTYTNAGSSVTLHCNAYSIPGPVTTWLKDGEELVPGEIFQVSTGGLTINQVIQDDAGIYQCVADNGRENIQASAELIVLNEGVPIPTFPPETTMATTPAPPPLTTESPPDPLDGGPVPSKPVALSVSDVQARSFRLVWQQPSQLNGDILRYRIEIKWDGGRKIESSHDLVQLVKVISDLIPETTYEVTIQAVNENGAGEKSDVLEVMTEIARETLGPPIGVRARPEDGSCTAVLVTWRAPQGDVKSYQVLYAELGVGVAQELELYTEEEFYLVTNLKALTKYGLRVRAVNENGPGTSSDNLEVTTSQCKPSGIPANMTVEIESTSSVTVFWDPPPFGQRNGLITGYKMKYRTIENGRRLHSLTIDGTQRSHTLTELERGTGYEVRMAASNSNGTGPFSDWVQFYTFDIDKNENGVPPIPRNLHTFPSHNKIVVSWDPPLDETIMIRGYMLGYGPFFPDATIERLSSSQTGFTITNLTPSTTYVLKLRAYNRKGEGDSLYDDVTTTLPGRTGKPGTPVGLQAVITSPYSAVLSWGNNDYIGVPIPEDRYYTVKYKTNYPTSNRYMYVNSSDLSVIINNLSPFTEYQFEVMAVSGNRHSEYSLVVVNKTFEAAPSSPPRSLTVVNVENSTTALTLNWQPPRNPNGPISGYTIYYSTNNSPDESDWIEEVLTGDELTRTIHDLTSDTTYYFKIRAHTSKGEGPISEVVSHATPAVGPVIPPITAEGLPYKPAKPVQPTQPTADKDPTPVPPLANADAMGFPWWLWLVIILAVLFIIIIAVLLLLCFICGCCACCADCCPCCAALCEDACGCCAPFCGPLAACVAACCPCCCEDEDDCARCWLKCCCGATACVCCGQAYRERRKSKGSANLVGYHPVSQNGKVMGSGGPVPPDLWINHEGVEMKKVDGKKGGVTVSAKAEERERLEKGGGVDQQRDQIQETSFTQSSVQNQQELPNLAQVLANGSGPSSRHSGWTESELQASAEEQVDASQRQSQYETPTLISAASHRSSLESDLHVGGTSTGAVHYATVDEMHTARKKSNLREKSSQEAANRGSVGTAVRHHPPLNPHAFSPDTLKPPSPPPHQHRARRPGRHPNLPERDANFDTMPLGFSAEDFAKQRAASVTHSPPPNRTQSINRAEAQNRAAGRTSPRYATWGAKANQNDHQQSSVNYNTTNIHVEDVHNSYTANDSFTTLRDGGYRGAVGASGSSGQAYNTLDGQTSYNNAHLGQDQIVTFPDQSVGPQPFTITFEETTTSHSVEKSVPLPDGTSYKTSSSHQTFAKSYSTSDASQDQNLQAMLQGGLENGPLAIEIPSTTNTPLRAIAAAPMYRSASFNPLPQDNHSQSSGLSNTLGRSPPPPSYNFTNMENGSAQTQSSGYVSGSLNARGRTSSIGASSLDSTGYRTRGLDSYVNAQDQRSHLRTTSPIDIPASSTSPYTSSFHNYESHRTEETDRSYGRSASDLFGGSPSITVTRPRAGFHTIDRSSGFNGDSAYGSPTSYGSGFGSYGGASTLGKTSGGLSVPDSHLGNGYQSSSFQNTSESQSFRSYSGNARNDGGSQFSFNNNNASAEGPPRMVEVEHAEVQTPSRFTSKSDLLQSTTSSPSSPSAFMTPPRPLRRSMSVDNEFGLENDGYWSGNSHSNLLSSYQSHRESRETRGSETLGSEARRGRSRLVGDKSSGGISSRSRSLDRFGEREDRHVSPVGGYDYHGSSQRQHSMDRPAYMYPTNTASSGYHSDTNTTSSHDDGSSTQGSTSRAGNPLSSFSVPGPPPSYQNAKVKIQAPAYSPLKRTTQPGVARVRAQPLPVVTPRAPDVTYRGVGDGTSPGAANRSFSTEDLNTEMLNLEGLMKDLNAITASELQS